MCILIRGFDVNVSLLTACSIFGVATVVGALSFLPGGLGGFEVVMGLLLGRLGMSLEVTTLLVAVFRFCSLWLGSFVGLVVLLVWLAWAGQGSPKVRSGDPQ